MSMRSKLAVLAAIVLMGAVAKPVRAQEEVVLQQANGDSQARAINTWLDRTSQNTAHSADVDLHIQAGQALSTVAQRALLQFDFSRIPRAGIKGAKMVLLLDTAPASNRTWGVHLITSFQAVLLQSNITWANRTNQLLWSTAGGGGDFNGGTIATTATGTTSSVTLSWDIVSAVKSWQAGIPPTPNYGVIIKDETEQDGTLSGNVSGLLATNQNVTPASRPALYVDFIQEVRNPTATAGNGVVNLSWTFPAAIGTTSGTGVTGLALNPTSGVVILRFQDAPVPDAAFPTDGTALPSGSCPTIGGATVVLSSSSLTTSLTDNLCSITNGHTYFYKVFAAAKIGATTNYNYSTNGTVATGQDTGFVTEIAGTPSASSPQAPDWIAPVRAASLGAPGLDPGNLLIAVDNNPVLQGFNPSNGNDVLAPMAVGGPVSSRPPILRVGENDLSGPLIAATYILSSQSSGPGGDLQAIINVNTVGSFVDYINPLFFDASAPHFTGSIAIYAKAFSNIGNLEPSDDMIFGTNIVGDVNNNIIISEDVNTTSAGSGTGWRIFGNSTTSLGCSTIAFPAVCMMDGITSTPLVDYIHNTIWVTTHNNNSAAGTAERPDIWKMDASAFNGNVSAAINVGGDIDSSPTLSIDNTVVFVGTNAGKLFAFDAVSTDVGPPVTPHQYDSFTVSPNNGAIKGFPLVIPNGANFTVIFSMDTTVEAITFVTSTDKFSAAPISWKTSLGCNPTTPVGAQGVVDNLSNPVIFVGCSDGKIHQLRISDGVDEAQRITNPAGGGVTVGDLSLDLFVSPNKIFAGTTDGRIYAFAIPFI